MQISNTNQRTLSEKIKQAAEAEYRKSEKSLTQASGAEMGLGKEENQQRTTVQDMSAATDSLNLSASAMSRYRAIAGSETNQKQSFSRQGYLMQEESRKAAAEKSKADAISADNEKSPETGDKVSGLAASDAPLRKSGKWKFLEEHTSLKADKVFEFSGFESAPEPKKAGAESEDGSLTAGSGEASGAAEKESSDVTEELKKRVKEVQQKLGEAQARMGEAVSAMQEAMTDVSADDGSTGQMSAAATTSQTEAAAAEAEVAALSAQLLSLYQQLMEAQNAEQEGK